MDDTAAHLVDRVPLEVPIRQWVLTLPYPLRLPCARNAPPKSSVLRAFLRALFADQRRRAKQVPGIRRGAMRGGDVHPALRLGDEPHTALRSPDAGRRLRGTRPLAGSVPAAASSRDGGRGAGHDRDGEERDAARRTPSPGRWPRRRGGRRGPADRDADPSRRARTRSADRGLLAPCARGTRIGQHRGRRFPPRSKRADRATASTAAAVAEPGCGDPPPNVPIGRSPWADLLQRVFEVEAFSS